MEVNNINIFPEPIDEIKTTQAEVNHCQFGIYTQLKENPDKIDKRKVSRNTPDSILNCEIINDSKDLNPVDIFF